MSKWLRSKDEIVEYPYTGTITRIVAGSGMEADTTVLVYEGVMDEHMRTSEEGNVMQTSSYIISIPLTKDDKDCYIIPKKGDKISITVFCDMFTLTVDNAEPSQLGGVSVYATRNSW